MESDRRPRLDSSGSSSFNYSLASSHSVQTHKDLQKGISLLKKSVACITAYCYNSLCFDIPSEASTFEAFAKLLATLSSSKEVRSVFSLKMARSRYYHIYCAMGHSWIYEVQLYLIFQMFSSNMLCNIFSFWGHPIANMFLLCLITYILLLLKLAVRRAMFSCLWSFLRTS